MSIPSPSTLAIRVALLSRQLEACDDLALDACLANVTRIAAAEDRGLSLDLPDFLADFSDPGDDAWIDPLLFAGEDPGTDVAGGEALEPIGR